MKHDLFQIMSVEIETDFGYIDLTFNKHLSKMIRLRYKNNNGLESSLETPAQHLLSILLDWVEEVEGKKQKS